jgi:hypothetical protein
MTDNTAAARKALQRVRMIRAGLTRVEVVVPEDRKDEIKHLAAKMLMEREQPE